MKSVLIAFALSATVLVQHQMSPKPQPMHAAAVETYEHLATAIIEVKATEDSLVKGILLHHHAQANQHLEVAYGGTDVKQHLEAAAEEIANIANEGDKPVQAIRQRLLKAGHHHHTDAETKEDYMFIDSKEKAALLALSGKVGKMAGSGSADEIRAAMDELNKTCMGALAAE